MKFHSVHGGAIRLEADKSLAIRKKGFCDGITFSQKPIKVGQCYSIRTTYAKQWSGALRLGVTSHDPAGFNPENGVLGVLPKYACPDLLSRDGFWAKPVKEEYLMADGGTKVTFQLIANGKMLLFINNELKGSHLTDLPSNGQFWAIIDVYGTTDSVQILPEGEAPIEVIARGPKFLEAYKRAMRGGTAPLRHFRLYVVGREGVGKTSLVKSLTGQPFDSDELPTAGVDCYTNFEVEVGSGQPWKPLKFSSPRKTCKAAVSEQDTEDADAVKTLGDTIEEQELLYSIAKNIVWEMKQGSRRSSPSRCGDGWRTLMDDSNNNPNNPFTKAKASLQRSTKHKMNNNENSNQATASRGSKFRNFVKRHQQSVAPEEKENAKNAALLDWHQPLAEMSHKLLSAIEDLLATNETQEQEKAESKIEKQQHKKDLKSSSNDRDPGDKKITLDLWDMSGNYAYYPALFSSLVNRAIYLVVFDLTCDLDALSAPDASCNGPDSFESCQVVSHRRRSTSAPGLAESRRHDHEHSGKEDTLSGKSMNRSKSSHNCNNSIGSEWEMTNLDYILHWIESIFVHATASAVRHDGESLTLTGGPEDECPVPALTGAGNSYPMQPAALPIVFVVGTHKNALNVVDAASRDKLIKEKFAKIKECIAGKPYESLVNPNFMAVESNPYEPCNESFSFSKGVNGFKDQDQGDPRQPVEDDSLATLRQRLGEAGWRIQLTGQQVPLSWLQLRARLAASASDGISFLTFDQVKQISQDDSGGAFIRPRPTGHHHHNLEDADIELWSALDFLHDVGSVTVCNITGGETGFLPSSPDVASVSDIGSMTPLIVLKPAWLVQILAFLLHPNLATAVNKSLECAPSNKSLEEESRMSMTEPESSWVTEYPNYPNKFHQNFGDWETACSRLSLQWTRLERDGLLEQCLFQQLFLGESWVQESILALLAHHDILAIGAGCGAQQCGQSSCRRLFFVPSRIFLSPPPERILQDGDEDNLYYIHFQSFFSDALFARLVTRVIQWSQESMSANKKPALFFRTAVLWLEGGHTLILHMSPLRYSRIKVRLTRQTHLDDFGYDLNSSSRSVMSMGLRNNRRPLQRETCYNGMPRPAPQLCAKVRHMLESLLLQMRQAWVRRLCYRFMVRCPCDKACSLHRKRACLDENCLHFLSLDECLNNSVVPCDYRRIKTEPYRLWFPSSPKRNRNPSAMSITTRQMWTGDDGTGQRNNNGPSSVPKKPTKFWEPALPDRTVQAIPDHLLPDWMTTVAKMLLGSPEGNDWTALGQQLGYRAAKLEQMDEHGNPALALLRDWVSVSGNSYFCLETLVSCLDQIHRQDVSALIRRNSILGSPTSPPPDVFISYDWESQEGVLLIRTNLEKSGFVCWMDVGQMGGGDSLYARIYQGISQAKVFLSFITPRYVVSQWSRRELSLADVMRKPIIPVILSPTPWPPPGPMAIVLAPLVFIDMSGMGGHGGSGRHGDWETRFRDIVFQVSGYVTPKQGSLIAPAVRPKSNAQILEVSDFGRPCKLDVGDGGPPPSAVSVPGGGPPSSSAHRGQHHLGSAAAAAAWDSGGVLRINPNLPPAPQPIYIEDDHDSSPLRSFGSSTTRARSSAGYQQRQFGRGRCYPHCLQSHQCAVL